MAISNPPYANALLYLLQENWEEFSAGVKGDPHLNAYRSSFTGDTELLPATLFHFADGRLVYLRRNKSYGQWIADTPNGAATIKISPEDMPGAEWIDMCQLLRVAR